ncbi:MAG TPA: hypothetical protein VIV11_24465 [Kofleriaceae bacterium]
MKAIWFVVLAGCASAKAGETLGESVRAYNDGVRWERFAVAAVHIPPEERGTFVDLADERANDLKITDYEVLKVDAKGEKEATVQIKMSWYRESEGLVRETQALQTWEKHGKSWWMVDEARLRGHEMPGLQEALSKPEE